MSQVETYTHGDSDREMPVQNDYGSGDSSADVKRPMSSFGFLKNLTSDKTIKADGQPAKRRGPKPDSKPAITRRQELNRQAQRTHRERKEMYIKALEQEVLRLKETYGGVVRDRNSYEEENRRLRELLAQHNIAFPETHLNSMTSGDASSSGSISGSYAAGSSYTGGVSSPPLSHGQQGSPVTNRATAQKDFSTGIDYDQIGIDFVLTLERPCMDHMQMLCLRSNDSEADVSGHALMATCPPASHLIERPEVQYPHKMPDLQPCDLMKLLDLSNRLALGGEITPIMAWSAIAKDERFLMLTTADFKLIRDDLLAKVRCYGFGAVLEEFEVKDALESATAA